jgi:hypothetical protein
MPCMPSTTRRSSSVGPTGAPQVDPDRHVWLTLENEFNQASLLEKGFDAQWNDDGHNALHVLLTGETDAYYAEFADNPPQKLARCLSEGFIFRAKTTATGWPAVNPASHLAAQRVCAVFAEPRSDRQSCPWRTVAPTVFAPGVAGGHHLVADVADDPAALYG